LRLTILRSVDLAAGLVAAGLASCGRGEAQSRQEAPALRGAQPVDELSVRGKVELDPPPIKLKKPANVARIRPPPPPQTLAAAAAGVEPPPPEPLGPPMLPPEPSARAPRKPASDNPFDALGLRAGAFLLKPTIDVDFGYDSNPGQLPGKVNGATFTTVASRVEFASDWSRHALHGAVEGSFQRFFDSDNPNRPTLHSVIDGRADVRRDTALEFETRLNLDTERIGSDGVPLSATRRPLELAYGGTLGVVQRFGDTAVALRGNVDRNDYQEVTPGYGRDYTTYGAALRGTYEASPAWQPFVEASADWRQHDDPINASGTTRDSSGASLKAGARLEFSGALRGEASLGYGGRHYVDAPFEDISGVLANASLVWTPTALTTVTLLASTGFDETTVSGATSSVDRTVGVAVAHAFRRNLLGTASVSYNTLNYQGIERKENTIDATLGIEYRLSRSVAVRAQYAYEHLTSTVPGSDYTANSILVGLRLQR
jgi:hypothetical protein